LQPMPLLRHIMDGEGDDPCTLEPRTGHQPNTRM
jgi:hypothetical protein